MIWKNIVLLNKPHMVEDLNKPHMVEDVIHDKKNLKVVNGKMKYKDLIKTGDFIFNADATSLYPASMKGIDILDVSYPTGKSRWSELPLEEWNKKKIGFYKIKFCPPKNIRTPILPRKVNLG